MVDDIPGLRRILKTSKVIAVVGLSGDWFRPSYFAAKYMIEHGYTVIPVNPRYDAILGQKSYKSLRDIPTKVDMVDCFRKIEEIMPIAEDAIAIGAKVLWQQLGVKNIEAAKTAEAAGLDAIMDRCVKIRGVELVRRKHESHFRKTPPVAALLTKTGRHERPLRI